MNTQLQKSLSILLVGDSCVDQYMFGECHRLSPEAPVPILTLDSSKTVGGMASNVKLNLEALGHKVTFVTNDELILKTRYVDSRSGQQILRVDQEPKVKPLKDFSFLDTKYDAMVISDYDKGFLPIDSIRELLTKFLEMHVFVDTKKRDLKLFDGCFVKINKQEYEVATSYCSDIIVTLGKYGAKHDGVIYPTKEIEVTDVCGCGDTLLSAFASKYMICGNMQESIHYSNCAAGITAGHLGNYAPTHEEIMEQL
jgi:D-beta-D-heptose 7-phosphate kinase/D-beta-D-heptose 1-phosphate adenosyltransferase